VREDWRNALLEAFLVGAFGWALIVTSIVLAGKAIWQCVKR
jgi:hypothetical protein